MECIAIGIDVSKGRADIAFINESGTVLAGSGGFDDTRAGHDRLEGIIQGFRLRFPDAKLIAGLESTGGHERNWLGFFRSLQSTGRQVSVHRLNPLAVKRFLEADLHRKVDDRRAALGIARFLIERRRNVTAPEIVLDGRVVFYRTIRSLISQRAELRQQFQSLISSANPELVQYCRSGIPDWVLLVCQKYPTSAHVARCQIATLAGIPHVSLAQAEKLKAAAKNSTAALTDAGTAASVILLVEEILRLDQIIGQRQKHLIDMMKDDPRVALLDSIPGIGTWSAVALTLEIGDPTRFADVKQLIAWTGLDPRNDESGDGHIARGISHRGNAHLRAILFPLVMAAMLHHPIVAAFIAKKINEGKPKKVAMVAGEAKLLRIIYAILVSGKKYDPEYETRHARPHAIAQEKSRAKPENSPPEKPQEPDLTAPVSAKEAKKRKTKNNAPAQKLTQNEVEPQREPRADAPEPSPTNT